MTYKRYWFRSKTVTELAAVSHLNKNFVHKSVVTNWKFVKKMVWVL